MTCSNCPASAANDFQKAAHSQSPAAFARRVGKPLKSPPTFAAFASLTALSPADSLTAFPHAFLPPFKLLPMSPIDCYPCPRSTVTLVPERLLPLSPVQTRERGGHVARNRCHTPFFINPQQLTHVVRVGDAVSWGPTSQRHFFVDAAPGSVAVRQHLVGIDSTGVNRSHERRNFVVKCGS